MTRHPRHAEICAVLRRGGIVAMLSDTVYGLHGVAPAAGARLTALKGRSDDKPLLVLLADGAAAAAVTGTPPPPALAALWPGPLTIVLPVVQPAPTRVAAGAQTLAVRVPADPALRAIIAAVGAPLYSTSANRAGEPPLGDPAALRAAFGGSVDLVVDDGPVTAALPSTIVDVTASPPRVVRAGAVSVTAAQLAAASR
jgi:L-threonylcarbamoyladenylate synthase